MLALMLPLSLRPLLPLWCVPAQVDRRRRLWPRRLLVLVLLMLR